MITSCLHKKSGDNHQMPIKEFSLGHQDSFAHYNFLLIITTTQQLIMTRDDDSTIETTHKYAYCRVRRSTISHLTGLFKRHRHDMPE